MFILKIIRRLFKGLAGADSPTQIAFGFALGCVLGLLPLNCGFAALVLVTILILKVSFPFAVVAWSLTEILRISVLAEILAGSGFQVLEAVSLKGFWTALLNLPVIKLMGFQYYSVMGGSIIGVLLGAILYFPICFLVKKYREIIVKKLSESKWFKRITNLWLVRILKWIFIGGKKSVMS